MKSADLGQIISIVGAVGPLITTNLKKDEITALVSHSLTYLKYEVVQYNIPADGFWRYNDDTPAGSVIEITDLEGQRIDFAKFVYEELVTGATQATTQ